MLALAWVTSPWGEGPARTAAKGWTLPGTWIGSRSQLSRVRSSFVLSMIRSPMCAPRRGGPFGTEMGPRANFATRA